MKRILSLLLALTLCLGMLPANVWAEAAKEATEYVETTEETEETEETTLPTEPEETEPAEEEPAEEEPEVVETEAADGPEPVETVTLDPVTEVWINPEYRDLFSEADIGASDISGFEGEGTQCSSPEEVIEALREGLVNREENPRATLVTTRAYHEETELQTDILNSLFDHTGAPKEGDYLRRDIGYSAISMGISGTTRDGVTTWTYTFILTDVNYYTTAAQEREMDQEVSRVLSSLNLNGKSQKEKIDAIYNYLIRNVKYVSDAELADESNVIKYSSYAALVQHNAVCQGFAGAFYRLCLESGIDSRIVSSDAMNHAWNIVELEGSYYHLDATWDINWPDAPKYYLKGTTYWEAEHRSSTTGDISELGDQFADGSFAAAYPVPEGDYGEAEMPGVASGKCGDDLTWKLDGNGLLTISGTGAMWDYDWGETPWFSSGVKHIVVEKGVTRLGNNAFQVKDYNVQSASLPEGLLEIGSWALPNLKQRDLRLPESLTTIRDKGLYCASAETLYLPKNVRIIEEDGLGLMIPETIQVDPDNPYFKVENGALYTKDGSRLLLMSVNSGIREFVIPDRVISIDTGAFVNAYNLRKVTIGKGYTTVPQTRGAFGGYNLEEIQVDPANTGLRDIDGVLFSKDGTILLDYPSSRAGSTYTVPEGTEKLLPYSFCFCPNLTEVVLPEGLKTMDTALWACQSLKTVTIPRSITSLEKNAIGYLNGAPVEGFTVKGYSGSYAEAYAKENGFTFVPIDPVPVTEGSCGDNLTWKLDDSGTLTISGTGAMYDFEEEAPWLALEPQKLVLEEGITHISDSAFYRCTSLTGTLKLPDSLTSVGYSTFCGCKELTGTLVLPKNLTDIGEIAFADCGFTGGLTLPEGLTALSGEAFRGCKGFDGKLTLPKSLTSIGAFAFRSCGFTTVELYDAVETIGTRAFHDCGNLEKVIYHGTKEQWETITVGDGNEALLNAKLVGNWGYTIAFDGNGAEIGSMKNLEATVDAAVTLPEASFINPGYTFTGWNTQVNGKGESYQPGDQVKDLAEEGTVILYAQWRPSTYTAIFLPGADDCKGSVKDMPNLVNGKSYVFPKCGYTRTGYQFAGWGVERADDLIWNAGDKLKMTRVEEGYVAEFVARWTPITYTVRFNANKGTGKMPDQKEIPYGETTELSPCAFTRKGYQFTGWNTKANGTGETVDEALNLTATNKGTVTLYAQWEGEPYDVTFHFGEETRTQTLRYGTAEALDGNIFENPGYTFKCWTTQENGKGKSYKDGAKVTSLSSGENVDLYAQWTANKYTVVFHSNLAKDTTRKQTLTYDGKETALTANSFSWKGHAFQGWAEAEDAAEPKYTNKEKVRNLTTEKTIDLYAVWKVNEYTVAFNPNGAEGEEVTQDMTYDVPAELEANRFERQGYTFQGWATTAKGKAVHRDGKEVKNLTDKDGVTLRLYAVWAPTSYMVRFEPGEGATGTMKPIKMTYGKTYTLTGVSFKRANYTFAGWRDAETGELYANKAKVSDLCADGGTVTLVAQWVPTEYAITYKNLSTWEKEDLLTSYNVLTTVLPGTPSRPGCEFGGWYLDSGCKKPFTGFKNIAKPGKLTLYPKWIGTPSKYTIHFDPGAEDVTGRMADKKNLVCGKDYTLANNAFKRPGWQFAGWEIGGVTLANKAKFSNLPAYLKDFVSGGTVTLTAKWVQPGDGGDIPLK